MFQTWCPLNFVDVAAMPHVLPRCYTLVTHGAVIGATIAVSTPQAAPTPAPGKIDGAGSNRSLHLLLLDFQLRTIPFRGMYTMSNIWVFCFDFRLLGSAYTMQGELACLGRNVGLHVSWAERLVSTSGPIFASNLTYGPMIHYPPWLSTVPANNASLPERGLRLWRPAHARPSWSEDRLVWGGRRLVLLDQGRQSRS